MTDCGNCFRKSLSARKIEIFCLIGKCVQLDMGLSSSTPRTVHLDNDIPVGVIDVTDDVVQRLKGMNAQGLLRPIKLT